MSERGPPSSAPPCRTNGSLEIKVCGRPARLIGLHRTGGIKIYPDPYRPGMLLLVASAPDIASMAQHRALLGLGDWKDAGRLGAHPVLRNGDSLLATIPDLHLYHDGVDKEAETSLGVRPEAVVFLSKHRSESGTPSLTVHPLGNFGKADLGGRAGALVPAAPQRMTVTLRAVRRGTEGMGYAVTFEATHHGPFLTTPAFFIEAGSTGGGGGGCSPR